VWWRWWSVVEVVECEVVEFGVVVVVCSGVWWWCVVVVDFCGGGVWWWWSGMECEVVVEVVECGGLRVR
jgi:hypothetical protein